jgi:hypothetical protein
LLSTWVLQSTFELCQWPRSSQNCLSSQSKTF